MADLDIKNYKIPELLQFANIYEKNIEELSRSEIINGIDTRIIRSMQLQKPKYTTFFHKIKEALLEYLEQIHSEKELEDMEDDKPNEHDEGWGKAYEQKIITPEKEAAKNRQNGSKIIDKNHVVVKQVKLAPELQGAKLEYAQGNINSLFRQKVRHSLIINSQNRKLISYPIPQDLLGLASGNPENPSPGESSAKCSSLEEAFPPNPKMYVESESNFTITLSSPLKRIVKLKVTQIEIPISWYTFRGINGTTCFKIGLSTLNGEKYYPIDVPASELITISEGNYSNQELIAAVQTIFVAKGLPYLITYNPFTRKTTINNPLNTNFHLFFYLEKTPRVPANYSTGSPEIPSVDGMILDPNTNYCAGSGSPKVDYNLGWLLGFRQPRYSGLSSYTSESIVNTYGPRTIGIEINDFTNNSESDKAITIKEDGDSFSRAHGIEECEERVIPVSVFESRLDLLGCRPPRNPVHPDITKSGNFIKAITKKKFWANQQLKRLWKAPANRSRPYGNSFARLQVRKKEGIIIFANPNDNRSEKKYFGPVTISRLNLKLLDERGDVLDLNGQQWSIKIDAEAIYQF